MIMIQNILSRRHNAWKLHKLSKWKQGENSMFLHSLHFPIATKAKHKSTQHKAAYWSTDLVLYELQYGHNKKKPAGIHLYLVINVLIIPCKQIFFFWICEQVWDAQFGLRQYLILLNFTQQIN